MNSVHLIGRLTKDVELRKAANDISVTSFTLAVNRPFSDDQTDFIQCVAWRSAADNLAKYMRKGNRIAVKGRIQTRDYEKNDGTKVYITEIVSEMIQFLDPIKKTETSTAQDTPPPSDDDATQEVEKDDLPF